MADLTDSRWDFPDSLSKVPTKIDLDETPEEHFFMVLKKEKRFEQSIACYVLETLYSQIQAAKTSLEEQYGRGKKKTSKTEIERTINRALRKLLDGEMHLGLGEGLHADVNLNTQVLIKGLVELGAEKSTISISWVQEQLKRMENDKDYKKPEPLELELYFRHRYSSLLEAPESLKQEAFFKKISLTFTNVPIADRIGEAAERAWASDSAGLDVMGPYKKEKNDCFDFCMLILCQARGEAYLQRYMKDYKQDSTRTIENERVDGTIAYDWSFKSKSAKKAFEDLKNMDGCMIQTYSWKNPGTGEHWGVYYKGYVYHFLGGERGIQKTEVKEFIERTGGKVLTVIKPREIENPLDAHRRTTQGAI